MGPSIPSQTIDIDHPEDLKQIISDVNAGENSDLDDEELELLLRELRHREARRAENIDRYRDLGFRVARTVVLVLGIVISGLSLLISEDLLGINIVESANNLTFGLSLLVMSYAIGTIVPLLLGYVGDLGVDQADEKAYNLSENGGSNTSSVRQPLINSYAKVINRNNSYVHNIRFVPVISAQLLLAGTILVGYSIVTSI